MRVPDARHRRWLQLAIVAVVLAVGTGTPSSATHLGVSGSAAGRAITYFHLTQGDARANNFFCRRQIQEESAGIPWLDMYAYDPERVTGPDGVQSYEYQRQPYEYNGTYRIGNAQVGPTALRSTLRVITYNGPSGSFRGPECVEPGPAPILDAVVSGRDAEGDELLCKYYDGVWNRAGANPVIVLHGTCTITTRNGSVTAPVRENRVMTPPPGEDCAPPRPGTGIFGAGDCTYSLSTRLEDDH